jgi:sugar phosphate isomerase/epimerase
MKLSFTTLGCPKWSWDKVLDEAARLGFDGIELRGVEGEFFLPKARPFLPENLEKTMADLKKRNIEICALDTSCSFHDPESFDKSVDEGKATIDLAEKLGVPYIRVFGNNVPNITRRAETLKQVAIGISMLCEHCEGKNVYVLLETHGDFSELDNLMPVLESVNNPHLGVLWDIEHTYVEFGEDQTEFFNKTSKYIKHTHIKDTKKTDSGFKLCLPGQGNVPTGKSIALLKSIDYKGHLSFEWEKHWHPELEEPEIAIPCYIEYIKSFTEN